ncbi:MAG TPA: hypothetical protein DCG84_06495, partial [Peptococcaceae bacterium]|nr:hypothetical protein [Peptococcaceae bacterium]
MQQFIEYLKSNYSISSRVCGLAEEAEQMAKNVYEQIEEVAKINQARVLQAFQQAGITEYQLWDGTGYGYSDSGREGLEEVYSFT